MSLQKVRGFLGSLKREPLLSLGLRAPHLATPTLSNSKLQFLFPLSEMVIAMYFFFPLLDFDYSLLYDLSEVIVCSIT